MKNNKIQKLNLYDYSCFVAIAITFAFHNVTSLLVVSQLFFALMTFIHCLKGTKITINSGIVKYIVWYGLFIMFAILSFLWSIDRTSWLSSILSLFQVSMLGICIIIYCSDITKQKKMIKAILLGAGILCLKMIIMVPLSAWGTERLGTYIGYKNVTATNVLSYASIIAFYVAIKFKIKRCYILSIIYIFISLMTGTKKGIFIFLIGILIILVFESKNPIRFLRNIFLFLLIIGVMYYTIVNYKPLYNVIGHRVENFINQIIGKGLDKSTRDRSLLIQFAISAFKQSPIYGVGIDAFKFYDSNYLNVYAHNNFLEILADLGIIGFVLYYYMHLYILIKTIKYKSNYEYKLLIVALLIVLLLSDFTSVSYSHEMLHIYLCSAFGFFVSMKNLNNKKI